MTSLIVGADHEGQTPPLYQGDQTKLELKQGEGILGPVLLSLGTDLQYSSPSKGKLLKTNKVM